MAPPKILPDSEVLAEFNSTFGDSGDVEVLAEFNSTFGGSGDVEVIRDFNSPFKGRGDPEVVRDPNEVEHSFTVGDLEFTCWAKEDGMVEFMAHDLNRPGDGWKGIDSLSARERDQLQAGVNATLKILRRKLGRPFAVFGAQIPRDWPDE